MQGRALPAGGALEQRPDTMEIQGIFGEQPAALDGRRVGI